MKTSIQHRFAGMLLLALVLLAAIAATRLASYRSTLRLITTNRQIDQTEAVIGELRGLLAAVERAEVEQSGYLISGRELDLEPYRSAREPVERHLRSIESLIRANPLVQLELGNLGPLVRTCLDDLDRIVVVRQTQGFDAAATAVFQQRQSRSLDTLRATIARLDDAENATLQRETRAAADNVKGNLTLFLIFCGLDVAILLTGALALYYYVRQRDHAHAQMLAAKDAAEKANQAKDDFVAMVSHDLRSPLNVIGLWLDLLRRKALGPEDYQEALDAIGHSVASQSRLVDDLLDLSRIVHGKFQVECAPMDLAACVASTVAGTRGIAEAAGVRLEMELAMGTATILGDAERLQQVVGNLLGNALKFTPRGGSVRVRLRPAPAGVEFQVADTGHGIEAGFLPHIFDRFSQAKMPQSKKGLGLGLAIVKHIVELHGGTVIAQSDGRGRGATFTVTLPLLGASAGTDVLNSVAPGRPTEMPQTGPPAPTGGAARIDASREQACRDI